MKVQLISYSHSHPILSYPNLCSFHNLHLYSMREMHTKNWHTGWADLMLVLSLENERLHIAGVLGNNFHGFYAINFFVIGKSNAFSLQTDNVCDSSWKRVTPKSHNTYHNCIIWKSIENSFWMKLNFTLDYQCFKWLFFSYKYNFTCIKFWQQIYYHWFDFFYLYQSNGIFIRTVRPQA